MTAMTDPRVEARRSALEARNAPWVPRSLAAQLDVVAAQHPDRPYVLADGRSQSYREVAERSRTIAAGLMSLGVQHGDRVALLVDNRAEYPAIKFGVARAGAIAVPLNYSYKADEIGERLRQSAASVVIMVDASAATDFLAAFDQLVPGWESGVSSTGMPELRHIVLVEAHAGRDALDLGRLGDGGVPAEDVDARLDQLAPDDVCDIVFTSGTTGHALGAELTHDMVLRSAYGSAYHRAFDDGWRISFPLPLYHVFGYVEGMLSVLFVAGAIAPLRLFNPKTVLDIIERERINEALFVPTMTVAVVDQAVKEPRDLSSLESVCSAAAPAPAWLWERVMTDLAPRMIFTGYGQTEVSAATAMTHPGDDIATVSSTVGTTKLGGIAAQGAGVDDARLAEYRTIDPFSGEVLPPGRTGELSVRGPLVTHGYFGDPERTQFSVDAEGWLRTGDLGCVDEQGYLRLDGRSSELFKVGGELVSPLEVEQVLTAMPGISQAFVAGVPDERFGDVAWAWIVPAEGAEIDEQAVLRELRRRLARFKVPRGITIIDAASLPVTTTGKVQKFLLVRSLQAEGARS